jgi:K+-sensing histidine kinase KdpD
MNGLWHPNRINTASAGGTIKAENREYGGCRFVVELPIQKDEAI